MAGPVERAVRSSVEEGARLPTTAGKAGFVVDRLDSRGVTLLFGPPAHADVLLLACLEGIVDYLQGRNWTPVGANRDVRGNPNTLDWYLKQHVARQTTNYVAVLLNRAGVLDLETKRPARVRLSSARNTGT